MGRMLGFSDEAMRLVDTPLDLVKPHRSLHDRYGVAIYSLLGRKAASYYRNLREAPRSDLQRF
ncbi:MAG: hypothetical protein NZ955_06230 [Candidatus Bathyarchaeota archaeon]|nr:hypothetical protein [Candidatus Bathyarchaeota archaeon]MCX8161904.1 hypothetical protein [Candidatus Bathyarchaeota archaeon]